MMERIIVAFPGGNPTAIVGEWAYFAEPQLFAHLMDKTNSEQAGSIRVRHGRVHLRMMGWELSLNGLVSAAIAYQVLAERRDENCQLVCDLGGEHLNADARIVWQGEHSAIVRLEIQKLAAVVAVAASDKPRFIVRMPGIEHLLVPSFAPTLSHQSLARELIEATHSREPAQTVLFHGNLSAEFVDLEPYVYVRDVRSFVRETSCGSGAVALGIVGRYVGSLERMNVRQPSGVVVGVKVDRYPQNDATWSFSYETAVKVIGRYNFERHLYAPSGGP